MRPCRGFFLHNGSLIEIFAPINVLKGGRAMA